MRFLQVVFVLFVAVFATAYASVCVPDCPVEYKQVCGQHVDGSRKTYVNSCRMTFEACRTGKPITQVNRGPCKK
uniref:Kazal-like domain-containing protein n=1 Tax=Musca domestica TaxID=7370 RepID=A0A1I8MQ67_MUSDO